MFKINLISLPKRSFYLLYGGKEVSKQAPVWRKAELPSHMPQQNRTAWLFTEKSPQTHRGDTLPVALACQLGGTPHQEGVLFQEAWRVPQNGPRSRQIGLLAGMPSRPSLPQNTPTSGPLRGHWVSRPSPNPEPAPPRSGPHRLLPGPPPSLPSAMLLTCRAPREVSEPCAVSSPSSWSPNTSSEAAVTVH